MVHFLIYLIPELFVFLIFWVKYSPDGLNAPPEIPPVAVLVALALVVHRPIVLVVGIAVALALVVRRPVVLVIVLAFALALVVHRPVVLVIVLAVALALVPALDHTG